MHERIQHSKADVMKIDAERNVLYNTTNHSHAQSNYRTMYTIKHFFQHQFS